MRFSEERRCCRIRRHYKAFLLDMGRNGLTYRAYLIDHERWTKTEEYQAMVQRHKQLWPKVLEELAKGRLPGDREAYERYREQP